MTTKERINEMILNTIATNREDTPKYLDELTALGYTVERPEESPYAKRYWKVNGLTGSNSMLQHYGVDLRSGRVEGYEHTSRVDYVDYLEKAPQRGKRREWAEADDGRILQRRSIRKGRRPFSENKVVAEYKKLKEDAAYAQRMADKAAAEWLEEVTELRKIIADAQYKITLADMELRDKKMDAALANGSIVTFLEEHGVK